MKNSIYFRWLGVAGIELSMGSEIMLIDPYLTRIPLRNILFGPVHSHKELIRKHIPRCHHILVTHSHFDHLMDVPFIARYTGAEVFGSASTCRLLSACGVPPRQFHEIDVGDRLYLNPFHFQVLPAHHVVIPGFGCRQLPAKLKPPLWAWHFRMDKTFSFLIEADGLWMMIDLGQKCTQAAAASILFMQPRMTAAQRRHRMEIVRPRLVVPVHWDDFFRPLSRSPRPGLHLSGWKFPPLKRLNMTEFSQALKRDHPAVEILLPQVLHTYDLRHMLLAPSVAQTRHQHLETAGARLFGG